MLETYRMRRLLFGIGSVSTSSISYQECFRSMYGWWRHGCQSHHVAHVGRSALIRRVVSHIFALSGAYYCIPFCFELTSKWLQYVLPWGLFYRSVVLTVDRNQPYHVVNKEFKNCRKLFTQDLILKERKGSCGYFDKHRPVLSRCVEGGSSVDQFLRT
jgi:hypothetical protein